MLKTIVVLIALMTGGGILYKAQKTDFIPDVYSTERITDNPITEIELDNLSPTLSLKVPKKVNNSSNKLIILEKGNTVVFRGEVSQSSVTKVQLELQKLIRTVPKNKPIYLVLDTPGGSVFAGLNLIDFIKGLNRKV